MSQMKEDKYGHLKKTAVSAIKILWNNDAIS